MRALRIHGPSTVSVDEVPKPCPGEDEVLVRVRAVGICGSDVELYHNDNPHIQNGETVLPIIPGHEWAGEIAALGSRVTGFRPGDRVVGENAVSCGRCEYCRSGHYNLCQELREVGIFGRDGAFAEYVSIPAALVHKFGALSYKEAALIEPMTVSLYAVQEAGVNPMDSVLVTGDGPIGLLAVQILKKVYGVKLVILSGRREARLAIGMTLGADAVINAARENVSESVSRLTGRQLAHRVIETSGGSSVFSQLRGTLRQRGRIVVVGLYGSKSASFDWDELVLREYTVVGVNGSPGNWGDAIAMAETGKIQLRPLISHVLKLEEFEKGIDILVGKKENACKVVLEP